MKTIIEDLKNNEGLVNSTLVDVLLLPKEYNVIGQPYYQGKGVYNVEKLERLLEQYKEYAHQQNIIKQGLMDYIKEYEQPYIDRIKELENALKESEKKLKDLTDFHNNWKID